MTTYQQMGHDCRNLIGTVPGFAGAILSPVNESEDDMAAIVAAHRSNDFEFIFDPQLYFPQRGDRGQLSTWSYFPRDFDTADMSSSSWWQDIVDNVAETARRLGASVVCSPANIPGRFANEYYTLMREHAARLVSKTGKRIRVLQTCLVKLEELADTHRVFELASLVSHTKSAGVYLILLCDTKPRDELRRVEQLKGAMRFIFELESAGLPVLVACSSSDLLLWKTAGATSCATGKFANLRRFTTGRFSDPDDGGRLFAYWFEEALLAFIRASDLARIQPYGMGAAGTNPFAQEILTQIVAEPEKPWVALGWRQYMHWFADVEHRLASGKLTARSLIRAAEKNWQTLEANDVFMEERNNDGSWLRSWLRAVVEFKK